MRFPLGPGEEVYGLGVDFESGLVHVAAAECRADGLELGPLVVKGSKNRFLELRFRRGLFD